MKNRLYIIYPKNQLYIILIIFFGVFYAVYLQIQYQQTIERGELVVKNVIKQGCNAFGKGASGVLIKHRNKTYSVKLDYETCIKYPENSRIKVFYNKDIDKFIYPVKNPNSKNRVIFLIVILFISIIPWTYLLKLTNSNKGKK